MVVRYMGTKRHMADHVRNAITGLNPSGSVVDLFSGMGSVAESLADSNSVITNDAMSFAGAISRARFTKEGRASSVSDTANRLQRRFEHQRAALEADFSVQLVRERQSLDGGRTALSKYMTESRHVGNDPAVRRQALRASTAANESRYQLATLYFSAGYLSLRQSIDVDALRYAIDHDSVVEDRDWQLAAWIAAMSIVLNAPGHTAQFLKPNSDRAHMRMARTWRRPIWDEFVKALSRIDLVGSAAWRAGNAVNVGDALEFVGSDQLAGIGLVYADPPYTKDQYSRFYHVYETLYRYDFPDSLGVARSRSDRFSTGFSLKSAVLASFHDLCRQVARAGVPLVISYPSTGLLVSAGSSVPEVASAHFESILTKSFDANHSTLGASSGNSTKFATENLYVCTN